VYQFKIHGSVSVFNPKNPVAVASGRLCGVKGGKAISDSLTAERRKEIAEKAVDTRWQKNKK